MCVICRLKQAGVSEELLREVQATANLSEGFRKVLNRIEEERPGTIRDDEDEALTLLFNAANPHNDAFNEPGESHDVPLSEVPDEVLARVRELFGDDVDIKVVRIDDTTGEIEVGITEWNHPSLSREEYTNRMRKLALDIMEDLPDNTPIDKRKLH